MCLTDESSASGCVETDELERESRLELIRSRHALRIRAEHANDWNESNEPNGETEQ